MLELGDKLDQQRLLLDELKVSQGLEIMCPGCFEELGLTIKWHYTRKAKAGEVDWFLNIFVGNKEPITFTYEAVHPWVRTTRPSLDDGSKHGRA